MSYRHIFLLVLGVLAASWSGPLVRLAADAPPVAIAFWRTALATLVILPFAWTRQREEIRALRLRDVAILFAAGAFLALHFATWIASLRLTTIASAVLLVSATPVFVAIASAFMGEPAGTRGWVGIAVAVGGGAIVAGADVGRLAEAGLGNFLALSGSAAAAGYLLIGRRVRPRLSLLTYVAAVYGFCALLLLLGALAAGISLVAFDPSAWPAIIAITLGPQLIGHTIFNFLLQDLEATKVTVATLGEPIGASLIAAALFAEIPGLLVLPGGALLLAGIGVVVVSRRIAEEVPPTG